MRNLILILVAALGFTACGQQQNQGGTQAKGGDINVAEAAEKMKESDVLILDVRTPREFAEGHIKGAKNININGADFDTQIDALSKDQTVVVYCRSGGRSARAMGIMQKKGFTEVYNMQGGVMAWSRNGKALE